MGEATARPLRLYFDRRIKLEFHGARITSDDGLFACGELDGALGLTDVAITSSSMQERSPAAEKLVEIGARIVRHGRYVVFQLAEVALPRPLFADILPRIDDLRPKPPPLPA